MKDSIGRRKSNQVQPTGKKVYLTAYDYALCRGLRRYPDLPTDLAARLWKPDCDVDSFRDRAKHLTHETNLFDIDRTPLIGPLLHRPWELNPDPPNPEPAWYENAPLGERLAATEAPRVFMRDDRHHRGANSCVGASFEILAPEYELEAVHHEEIFLHERCPEGTRTSPNPIQIDDYEPDALFGLHEIAQGRRRGFDFFVREQDMGNVRFKPACGQTANRDKIDKLLRIFASRLYEARWGLPNLRAMFVMTSQGRIQTCLDYLADKPHGDRFLFKAIPQFHRRSWKAPRQPLRELFEPWQTTKGFVSIIP